MQKEKELYCAWNRNAEARDLFNAGIADIRYRFHFIPRGGKPRWTGIRSFRKSIGRNSGVMWPWDMVGAPGIDQLEWWVERR